MTSDAAPIALNSIFFTKSCVVSIRDHAPAQGQSGLTNKLDVHRVPNPDGGRMYEAIFRAEMNPNMEKSSPYSIDMECVGVFSITDDSMSEEDALRGVNVTANGVLYGAIREAVANLTGRQPYGQLLLGLSHLRTQAPPRPTSVL